MGFSSPYYFLGGFFFWPPAWGAFLGFVWGFFCLPQKGVLPVTTSVVPGLTQVNQSVQVAERGDFRYPWVNLVDLRLVKVFKAGGARFEPTIDLYNVFNNNAVTSAVTAIGLSLGRPSAIVMGRLVRVGGRITF